MTTDIQPVHHGGEPPIASSEEGADWLDLSTGISPFAYPFVPPDPESWQNLPRRAEQQAALDAAADYFGQGEGGDICAGPGSQALLQAVPEVLEKGIVAIPGPTYQEHAVRWQQAGHEVREITALSAVSADCRYVVLVNPNNPTGTVFDRRQLLGLARQLDARDGCLIVDEAFGDVMPQTSMAGFAGEPGLLVLKSFGKFYGLAGLRIGFLLGYGPVVAAVREKIGLWPVNGPALSVAAQAYSDVDWINDHRHNLSAQASRLRLLLADYGQVIGGTDLFVLMQDRAAGEIFERLAEHHIHIRYFPDNPDWLRFGLPGEESAWTRLEAALKGGK